MNPKMWKSIPLAAVCVAALLAGGHAALGASDEALDEAGMIGVLESGADWWDKQAACRGLRKIGTAKSVPALAALLPDEELSSMARFALEPMPHPEAGRALRDALAKTQSPQKIGVIASIGMRRDPQAVALLVPLLKGSDIDVARAAARALCRIATPEAVQAMFDFRGTARETLRPDLAWGLIAAGQRLTQAGKGEMAAPIYQDLLASNLPIQVRMGAFHGLAYAQPKQAPDRLIKALGGDEALFRDLAARIVAETAGADATVRYADALPKLPAGGQAALLQGLAARKDPAAHSAVAKAVNSSDKQVKLAAVKALGAIGRVLDVTALAGLLATDDADIADAAKTSLTILQGEGVNPAIAAAIPKAGPALRAQLLALLADRRAEETVPMAVKGLSDTDAPVRVMALTLLADRGAEETVPMAVKSLGDPNASVRIAALRALGPLAGLPEMPVVVAALKEAADSSERTAAGKALTAICTRAGGDVLPALLDAMGDANPESRVVLLRALGRVGGPEALETVLAALDDSNEQISGEAVRALSEWASLDAVPHLLEFAQSDKLSRQVVWLRGYVRLALIEPSAKERAHMLDTAMDLAKRPSEKMLVLAGWETLPTEQSLDKLLPLLDDAAVRKEAAYAIIRVATEVGKENKKPAIEALKAVLEKCEDAEIGKSAGSTMATIIGDFPKAEKVLEKYAKAIGSYSGGKLKNRVTKGRYGGEGWKEAYMEPPNSRSITNMGVVTETGVNGDVAWEVTTITGPSILEGMRKVDAMQQGALNPLRDWNKLFSKAETVGEDFVGDAACVKVVMTSKEGGPVTLYFEKESGLLVKQEVSQQGGSVETMIGDYKEVDGIKIAHRTAQKTKIEGVQFAVEIVTTIDSVEHNVDIPASRFALPDDIKALLK